MRYLKGVEYFSVGSLLSRFWSPRLHVLPWIFAALTLTAVGAWDIGTRVGRVDFILMLSLAGYELVIGLTEERPVRNARP